MRSILRITPSFLLAVLVAAPLGARADHGVPVLPDLFPRVSAILSPLASQPTFVADGEQLRVELDPAVVGDAAIAASLTPSRGNARPTTALDLVSSASDVQSRLWPDRIVDEHRFALDGVGLDLVEDLYDLTVTYGSSSDTQHRAVQVLVAYPDEWSFVILADPSVGDPRPIQEGAEDLNATGSPNSLLDKTIKTIGNPMDEDRWAALGRAIDEINLLQPDFVLVAGDLTFAIYPRPANWEYEDAYRILSRLQVPTYLSPGNHDLYDFDYDDLERPHTSDGKELWPLYFGPLYYSVDIGPDLHVVSLNTFDWERTEREPFNENDEFDTRAGGQIDDEQMAWLEADLAAYRSNNPDGHLVTFAHHDPSWIRARHPWPGKNRLETRDLFASADVGAHFAGHTHEDRVARYHDGNVVETNGRRAPHGELHYILRDDTQDTNWDQPTLGGIVHDPSHGPAFVTTTTVSSVLKGSDWGQGSYWGYRVGVLRQQPGGGYDPADFGYPVTRDFLDARAERPSRWDVSQAEYGVFSYPSYLLGATGSSSEATVTNDLLVAVTVEVVLSVPGTSATATGGDVVWTRAYGGSVDVLVRATVPAGGAVTLHASPA